MKVLILPFLAIVCLITCGCPAYSVHPLYNDLDAVVEPALEGTWIDAQDDKNEFLFQKSGDHEYTLVVSNPESKIAQNYKVNLVRLGDQLYMDLLLSEQTIGESQINDPLGAISTHVILKVAITGNDLAYATLEDEPIQKPSTSAETQLGSVTTEGGLLVTATTGELRRYLSAHSDDAFSDWEHLSRKAESPQ